VEVATNADGQYLETNTYSYKLDEADNWIYCVKRSDKVLSEIKERTIGYYP